MTNLRLVESATGTVPTIDPLRAASAFRAVELFRRWSDARPGRMMRTTTVKLSPSDLVGMAEVGLYEGGMLVAECISADWFDALAHSLQIAGMP